MPQHRGRHRAALAAALSAAVILTGCGGDESEDDEAKGGETARSAADELVDAVNTAMAGTTFHAVGDTTVLEGGRQEMWSDPEVGLRIEVTADELESGETYCREGMVYTSVPLFTARLRQTGEDIEVPEDLLDRYVSTPVSDDCTTLYQIYSGATLAPELDGEVGGVPTTALVVEAQGNRDVYHVAAEGEPFVRQQESDYGGRAGETTYDSFGEPMEISMPDDDAVLSLDEFRTIVLGEETGEG